MMDNSCTEAQMHTPASVIASTPCHSLANIESCGPEIARSCESASKRIVSDDSKMASKESGHCEELQFEYNAPGQEDMQGCCFMYNNCHNGNSAECDMLNQ